MVVVFTAVVGVEALAARFGEAEPYNDRKAYVESAARMVRDRPGMGFGMGNWENAYPKYSKGVDPDKVVNHAHNDWAEWAVEGGLPLLAMMVAMGVWVVPKAVGSVWGLGVAGVVAHSLVDFPMQKPAMALWMFVVMGLVAGYAGDHLSEVARDPLKGGEVLELTGPE
jgi:O-antigen ligase